MVDDGETRVKGTYGHILVSMKSIAAAVLLVACVATPVRAQQSVSIAFDNGRVTVVARNAPVRVILAEWARLGGATVVNGDRVAGPPVTLELTAVPERQALDIILRNVAGYMLAPRRAGSEAVSAFDRIQILPTSVAPNVPTPSARRVVAVPRTVLQPPVARQRPGQPNPAFAGPGSQNPGLEPAEALVPGGGNPAVPRPNNPLRPFLPQPVVPEPEGVVIGNAGEQPGTLPQGVAPTRANPIGIPLGSSNRPGVIAPVPQPQQEQ